VNTQVLAVHAALLHSQKIMYFGGDENDKGQHDSGNIEHTRFFDLTQGVVPFTKSPHSDVFCSGHAMLADGRMLVAGGTEQFFSLNPFHTHDDKPGIRDSWIFDPSNESWKPVEKMHTGPLLPPTPAFPSPNIEETGGRWYPTLITLPDGRILAMSGHPGSSDQRHNNTSPELFAPRDGSWTLFPDVNPVRLYPRLHLLPDGDIFSSTPVQDLELPPGMRTQKFNVATRSWRDICGPPPDPDIVYGDSHGSSVLLPLLPGTDYRPRILIVGGSQPQVLDLGLQSPAWKPTGPRTLQYPSGPPVRRNLNAVLLPTGEVLIVGGVQGVVSTDIQGQKQIDYPDQTAVRESELYHPDTDQWETLAAANVIRNYHSVAMLLPDGTVWTAGSNRDAKISYDPPGADNRELRMEVFAPWYITAARPQVPRFSVVGDLQSAFRC